MSSLNALRRDSSAASERARPLVELQDIVHPLSITDFVGAYWPARPYFTSQASPRVDALLGLESLRTVEEFLTCYHAPISVLRRDGFSCRITHPLEALPLYRDGCTLYARHIERFIPEVSACLQRVSDQLGMPWGEYASAELFASTGDSGVSMHSDYDLNFQILLRGRKRWRLAINSHVQNQTNVCLPGNRAQRDPFQLAIASSTPLPSTFPENATILELEAGSCLFLPRGYWHETQATGECLALNFVFKGPQWREVVLAGLDRRLVRDPHWRQFAHGLGGNEGQRALALEEFRSLLQTLVRELGGVTPDQLACELAQPFHASPELDDGA